MDCEELRKLESLIARYTLNGDRGKLDALAACFAADGVLEFPGHRLVGPQDIAAALSTASRAASLDRVRHHLTTRHFEFTPGNRVANGRIYFLVITNVGLDHSGVYVDRYVRTDGQWLIAQRHVRIDWQSPNSLYERFAPAAPH